jgi:hypothetical protein
MGANLNSMFFKSVIALHICTKDTLKVMSDRFRNISKIAIQLSFTFYNVVKSLISHTPIANRRAMHFYDVGIVNHMMKLVNWIYVRKKSVKIKVKVVNHLT